MEPNFRTVHKNQPNLCHTGPDGFDDFDGKGKECAIPKESVLKRLRSVRAPAKCETEKL